MSSNEDTIIPYQPPKDLIENIQKWVLLDSKLKEINDKFKLINDDVHEVIEGENIKYSFLTYIKK